MRKGWRNGEEGTTREGQHDKRVGEKALTTEMTMMETKMTETTTTTKTVTMTTTMNDDDNVGSKRRRFNKQTA